MYMDVEIRGQSQASIIPQALPLFPLRRSLIGPELTQQVRLVPGSPTSPLQCYDSSPPCHTWVLGLRLQSHACYRRTLPIVVFQPTATPPSLPLASHRSLKGTDIRSLKPVSQAGKRPTCSFTTRMSALQSCRLCHKFLCTQTREPPGLFKISDPGYFVS